MSRAGLAALVQLDQPVTFTATVAAATSAPTMPTGSVVFKDGQTTLASAMLNGSGQASLTTSALTGGPHRSEEHTSELQSQSNLVCRLLLEKKKKMRLR